MIRGQPNIRALFFDFIGVLLFPLDNYIPNPTVDKIDALVGQVVDDQAFARSVQEDFQLSKAEFKGILDAIVAKYEPFKPLWELLPGLRKKYKLGIINNGTMLTYPSFDSKYGMSQRFDVFISSAAEGVKKPDARIYLRASDMLGIEPNQCLYMDDERLNVKGAREAGMQAIHWSNKMSGYQQVLQMLKMQQKKDG
jgi:HAD superfamily hydrolase (TIGR01509 family)